MARHVSRRRRDEPRTAWKIVLVLWIVFIWVHSMIPGPASSEESMLVVRIVQPLFRIFGVADTDLMQLIIRKGAHFSEYAVLGTLAVIALQPRIAVPLWPAVLTVILWVAVPSADEYIQLHVPGRAGMLTDVFIDMAGFAVGALITLLVRRIVEARERALAERERRARKERAAQYRRRARERAYERAGKPLPTPQRQRHSGPRHAPGVPVVPRGKHERIEVVSQDSRKRFEERTRG
ncbi:MAG: VanZ family protein [Coriobacteriales bacterium]|nr:VanZ family protein [Coriobacteriales bacterium]